jgi:hypothetical protein
MTGPCPEFKEPLNRGTEFYKDSCIRCGLPENIHKSVVIYYQDKILRFNNWTEARKKGFYPG